MRFEGLCILCVIKLMHCKSTGLKQKGNLDRLHTKYKERLNEGAWLLEIYNFIITKLPGYTHVELGGL